MLRAVSLLGGLLLASCAGPPVDPVPRPTPSAAPAPAPAPAPAQEGPRADDIRVIPIGSTHEGHAVTRGHNRKFLRIDGWSYVVWIDQLGSLGDFRPSYRASRDLVTWTPPRALSDIRNGGASGIDFEVLPPGVASDGPGRVVGLEAHYDDSLRRAWQYLRVYSARDGALLPVGEPVPVGAAGPGKAPSGYGSVARDHDGGFWVIERDEKGVAGSGENALLLYHASRGRSAEGGAEFVFDPKVEKPFADEARPRTGVTRAARVLCNGTFVVLVAYVEGPAGRGSSGAALYLRAFDRKAGAWGKTIAIAPPGAIVTDEPRLAPDVRPSAWVGRGGRLFVSWMPVSAPRTVAVSLLDAPYEAVLSTATALTVPEGRRPISAQVRIDSRFEPPRAYLFALSGSDSAAKPGEIAPRFLFTRFDGANWAPAEPFGPERSSCLYLGMAQPELMADDDPLVALTQDAWGKDMQVRLIDASARKFALEP